VFERPGGSCRGAPRSGGSQPGPSDSWALASSFHAGYTPARDGLLKWGGHGGGKHRKESHERPSIEFRHCAAGRSRRDDPCSVHDWAGAPGRPDPQAIRKRDLSAEAPGFPLSDPGPRKRGAAAGNGAPEGQGSLGTSREGIPQGGLARFSLRHPPQRSNMKSMVTLVKNNRSGPGRPTASPTLTTAGRPV
jgi:hypothetical protein